MARFRLLMVEGLVGLRFVFESADSRWCCDPELRLEGAKYSAFCRRVKGAGRACYEIRTRVGSAVAGGWTATSDYGAEAWLIRMVFADGRRNQDPSLRFGTTIPVRDYAVSRIRLGIRWLRGSGVCIWRG